MSASERETQIRELLEKRVRPALMSHGGDLEFVSLTDDDRLVVRLHGACSGCPASRMTLEETVATAVRESFPELKSIEVADPVGDDMIAQARKIMAGRS